MGSSLKMLLVHSGLFQEKNIEIISSKDDLGVLENRSSILMHWTSWQDDFQDVLEKKLY